MSGRYIPLAEPVHYSGKVFDKIVLSGHPFPGADSLFHKLRAELIQSSGLLFLHAGNSKMPRLSSYSIENLKLEAYAYAVRSKYKGSIFTITRDLKGAIVDMDTFKAIFQLIANQSRDQDVIFASRLEMALANVALKALMADLAVARRHYAWAKQLIEEASEQLHVCLNAPESQAFNARGDKLVANNLFKESPQKMEEILKKRIEDVAIERRREPVGASDLVPDDSPHPLCLALMQSQCIEKENFEEARMFRDRIRDFNLQMFVLNMNPFLTFVTEKILTDLVAYKTDARLRQDRIVLLSRDKLFKVDSWPGRLILMVKGDVENEKTFEVYDPSLHPRLLALIHSDPYVMMFGRFTSEIRLME